MRKLRVTLYQARANILPGMISDRLFHNSHDSATINLARVSYEIESIILLRRGRGM
jgi:hypothetical protein